MKFYDKPLTARGKKFCGCLAMVLMFAAMIFAYWQTDQRFMAAGLFAGVMYMLTTIAFVFEDGISTGEEK